MPLTPVQLVGGSSPAHVRFRRTGAFIPVVYNEGISDYIMQVNPDAVYNDIAWLSPWVDVEAYGRVPCVSTYHGMQWIDPAWSPEETEARRAAMRHAMFAALYESRPLRRRVVTGVVRDPDTHLHQRRWPSRRKR